MNAFFIASASILATVMFAAVKFSVLQVLFVFGLLNVPVIGILLYSAYRKNLPPVGH
jgi:hypothetical protein